MISARMFAKRFVWQIAIVAALAVLAIAAIADPFASTSKPPAKVVAHDLSGRATACLVADAATAAHGSSVGSLWQAMRNAAAHQKVNVQRLIVAATTVDQAKPYLAGLLNQHCALVVTVGTAFGGAAIPLSTGAQNARFDVVQGPSHPTVGNVTSVESSDATTVVAEQVRSLSISS